MEEAENNEILGRRGAGMNRSIGRTGRLLFERSARWGKCIRIDFCCPFLAWEEIFLTTERRRNAEAGKRERTKYLELNNASAFEMRDN